MDIINNNNTETLDQLLDALSRLNKSKSFQDLCAIISGESLFLGQLNELGGESTPAQLSKNLSFTSARLSAVLKTLEKKKLVTRIENEKDKRYINIKITDEGKALIEEKIAFIRSDAAKAIDYIGNDDALKFVSILNKMLELDNNRE